MFTQHFCDGQDQVRRRRALTQLSCESYTNDLRNQHGDRLTQHGRLSLDSSHAPSQHTQSVDHCGVRIRAHQSVGIREPLAVYFFNKHHSRQILQVHLMNYAGIRRNDGHVAKCSLPPAQESIAFFIP